jgi:hypothetical protein
MGPQLYQIRFVDRGLMLMGVCWFVRPELVKDDGTRELPSAWLVRTGYKLQALSSDTCDVIARAGAVSRWNYKALLEARLSANEFQDLAHINVALTTASVV